MRNWIVYWEYFESNCKECNWKVFWINGKYDDEIMKPFFFFSKILAEADFGAYELQVVSYELWDPILRKQIYKVILRDENLFCELEIKLRVASYFLQVATLKE